MDTRTIIVTLLLNLITGLIVYYYSIYRKKSIKEDIDFLEYEKKHLEQIKKSSVEMNRVSFRAIFSLFVLMGIANIIPIFISLFSLNMPSYKFGLEEISTIFTIAIWVSFIALGIRFLRRYDNLKNYKDTLKEIDQKIDKLQNKLKDR